MKRFKIFMTSAAFLLAAAATFATANIATPGVPSHYKQGSQCLECSVPNSPGNVYNIDYFCDTTPNGQRCSCINIMQQVKLATQNDPIACTPLWRYEL
ncbi:hypothetical protein LS482_16735 [Sinomicrobium kalidii]|uniref:hypothetical protein n=1 Tax=Sinomicrobium kalidii TaxID=2900738 RepID=UPI001E3CCF69|nr:hypothetical protein [Sinomicrobium kalidii]UGU15319.1 hypothetical protein LS482_16735 [Sinomicrobium kalidii]